MVNENIFFSSYLSYISYKHYWVSDLEKTIHQSQSYLSYLSYPYYLVSHLKKSMMGTNLTFLPILPTITILPFPSMPPIRHLLLSAYNPQVKLTKRRPTNRQLFHIESCRFYNGKHRKSTAYLVVGGTKVNIVFCFSPKLMFCSFDIDLDQAEQFFLPGYIPQV